jgi:hypothetical protein
MGNLKPTPKMAATGVAAGPAIALVWLLGQFGIDMPDYVAGVVVAGIMWLAGYLKSEGILKRKDGRHEAQETADA